MAGPSYTIWLGIVALVNFEKNKIEALECAHVSINSIKKSASPREDTDRCALSEGPVRGGAGVPP